MVEAILSLPDDLVNLKLVLSKANKEKSGFPINKFDSKEKINIEKELNITRPIVKCNVKRTVREFSCGLYTWWGGLLQA
jgi:hypothetical protein